MKNNILVSSDILKEINDDEQISRIFDLLKTKTINDEIVLNLNKLIEDTTPLKIEAKIEEKVKIVTSYKDEPKKRGPQDFVDYFNNRYKAIEKILKQRQELKNTVSISKITNKKEKKN